MNSKYLSIIIFILLFPFIQGCATNFTKVDFKYTSLAHISPTESTVVVNGEPENIIFKLSEGFRKNNATILERTSLDYYYEENESSNNCWQALCEIYNAEFESYRNNNFYQYKKIDRVAPFKKRDVGNNCKMLNKIVDKNVSSWFLMVEFKDRSGSITVPTTDTFFVMNNSNNYAFGNVTNSQGKNINMAFSTRLKFWVSEGPDVGKSTIYIKGIPISGQIAAAPGNSIGYSWWQLANGYEEYKTVKNYLNFIKELDHESYFSLN